MKIKIFLIALGMIVCASSVFATKGVMSTEADIERLKSDLRLGKLQVGKTRLNSFRETYGEAPSITEDARKVTYEYEDLKIDFNKTRYWTEWSFDGFKDRVYTADVDKLRSDLESDKLVGSNVTYDKLVRDYGEPTESRRTEEDGDLSIYYYGNIKMVFENFVVIKKWRGKNLTEEPTSGVLQGSQPENP